jgi:hypothetical protein
MVNKVLGSVVYLLKPLSLFRPVPLVSLLLLCQFQLPVDVCRPQLEALSQSLDGDLLIKVQPP